MSDLYDSFTIGDVKKPSRYHLELAGTSALAGVFIALAWLAWIGLLSFTQPTRLDILHSVASSDLWGWIFAVIGVLLIASLARRPTAKSRLTSRMCSMAAAFLGVWSFFTLLWGLTATYPVSLAAPALAIFAVVGAQVLAIAWNHKE